MQVRRQIGMPCGHPDPIADVLVVNAESYTKSNMRRMLLGDGRATSEDPLWRRQRNLLLPVFSCARLPESGPVITRDIDRIMGAWKDEGIHDIYREMMRLTWDVAREAFLRTQLDGRQDALLENLETIRDEFIVQADRCFMVPPWVPTRSDGTASHFLAAGSQGIATLISTGVVDDAPRRSRWGNRRLSRAERRGPSDGHLGRASRPAHLSWF